MNQRAGLGTALGAIVILLLLVAPGGPVSSTHRTRASAGLAALVPLKTGASPRPKTSAAASPKMTATPSRETTPTSAAKATATPVPTPSAAPPSGGTTTFPIRATFFYPWYPESWYATIHFTPTLGVPYSSIDAAVARYQIAAMEYANINVAIASWWGQGSLTDSRMTFLLNAAEGTALKWAIYYEPPPGTQASDLSYIYSRYAFNPSYEHVDGKPVLFVYSRSVSSCADAASWVNLNAGRFYLDLQVFGGYQDCSVQPNSWHQYAPATETANQRGYSYSVSPGFWLYSSSTPLLARDPAAFATAVRDMVASGEPWQLITTWNEWGEGTAVEDAAQWQSADGYGQYVDILHDNG